MEFVGEYRIRLRLVINYGDRQKTGRGGKLVSTMTILREFLWRRFCRKYSIDDRKGLADGTTSNELSWTFERSFGRSFGVSQAVVMLRLRNLSPHSEQLSSVASILKIVLQYIVRLFVSWKLARKLGNRSITMLIFWYSSRQVFFNRHKRHSSMFVIKLNITKVPLRAPLVGNVPKYSWSLWSLSVKFAFLFQILTIAAFCSVCRLVDFPFALSQKEVLFSAFPWLILSNYLNWSVKIKFNLAALLVLTHSVIR